MDKPSKKAALFLDLKTRYEQACLLQQVADRLGIDQHTNLYCVKMSNAFQGLRTDYATIRQAMDVVMSPTPRLVMLNQMRDEGLFTKDLTPEDITWLEEPQV